MAVFAEVLTTDGVRHTSRDLDKSLGEVLDAAQEVLSGGGYFRMPLQPRGGGGAHVRVFPARSIFSIDAWETSA